MPKQYDLIVFGASGFTGQYVAEEVSRIAEEEQITWAVAGRNASKLRAVLQNVKKATGTDRSIVAKFNNLIDVRFPKAN